MERDGIVEEVRAAREEYASRFDFDLRAICRDLKEKQMAGGRPTASFPPRKAKRQKRNTVAS